MIVFTHLAIAHYFYTNMKKQEEMAFKINQFTFLFGSIKPDISKMAKVKHHLEITSETYHEHIEMAKNKLLTNNQRSMALGIVCHYLSDYFCLYHAKKPFNEYSFYTHFKYEMRLHLFVISYLWKGRIEEAIEGIERSSRLDENSIDLASMLFCYHINEASMKTDTEFTFFAINKMLYKWFGITACKANENRNEERMDENGLIAGLHGSIVA